MNLMYIYLFSFYLLFWYLEVKYSSFLINHIFYSMNVCRVLDRFELQAAAFWPRSEVRGQTGSTGAAGNEVQGNRNVK